ncbi:xanthine dehydrogenase small subunit [Castellaniella sp.]|uniref:xanthine dehydrogenase small subunit n=1 Tax=Castellaniella sp. TaxID=1955812 RepID=UPI00355DAF42
MFHDEGVQVRDAIEFVFNGQLRRLTDFDPNLTVLRYVREHERALGSKEGCAEGDCGACTAVVAELADNGLHYRAVNTCIQFLATLDGKALMTVEHLESDAGLHPVQEAMAESHASQCGFCTPGFVMSMFAGAQNHVPPTRVAIDEMLAGNLCRCTGYTPIIHAAEKALAPASGAQIREADEVLLRQQLQAVSSQEGVSIHSHGKHFIAPATLAELAEILLRAPDATLLAGGTDVGLFVTKKHAALETVVYIGRVAELARIEDTPQGVRLAAAVTYAQASAGLQALYPDMGKLISRIGAVQVRNLGTVVGNIANGSPIGDMPPALIAAGARVVLRRGDATRELPLEAYFIAYGKQDRVPGEFIEALLVPRPDPGGVLKVYKISKRIDQDISSVCGAFNLGFSEEAGERVVKSARICFGGMAGTPLRASQCEAFLVGRVWDEATAEQAAELLSETYQPLNDARASAAYRNRVAGNLLRKFFHETQAADQAPLGVVHGSFQGARR